MNETLTEKTYPIPTEEQQAAVRGMFTCDRLKVTSGPKGYRVEVFKEGDYPRFEGVSFLSGMRQIADLLGCEEGDEDSRFRRSEGCSTCGFGSSYEVVWRFW